MESYADAVVGVPGEGLNVEQRKRLTIGVEVRIFGPLIAPFTIFYSQDMSRGSHPRETSQFNAPPRMDILTPNSSTDGRETCSASLPRRANLWPRQSNRLVDLQPTSKIGKQWPSYSLHHSSTFRCK